MKNLLCRQEQQSIENQNQITELPQGTCSPSVFESLQQYQIILSFPLFQYLTLPYSVQFFPSVILKENVDGQEPIYHIFHQLTKKRLLSAQKQPNNIGCNYIISKRQKPKKDQYFVGKLRGNFRNNQFLIFDCGQNPKKKCVRRRKQLGFIRYEECLFGKKQNKIQAIIPGIEQTTESSLCSPKYRPKQFEPKQQKQNLLLEEYKRRSSKIIRLTQSQKSQKLNHQNQESSIESMKYYFTNALQQEQSKINVNLGRSGPQFRDQLSLKFGCRTKNTYFLEIGYPFNLLQGFSIALSILETNNCS